MVNNERVDTCVLCGCYLPEGYGHVCDACIKAERAVRLSCDGCIWRGKRASRCSCCRRNINMKDEYRSKGV